ncbi:MAG: hypothetical protein R6X02_01975 [Enhygromyxa sp.]
MLRRLVPITALAVSLVAACDKGKSDDKQAGDSAKQADAKKADVEKEDAKKEDAKKEDAKKEAAKPEPKHFDVSVDKSGVLARTAAVLETTDATAESTELRAHLASISHHAEALTSDETLCRHIADLRKAEGQPEGTLESCVTHFEHQVVVLGPEVFAQMAQCIKDAKSVADVEVCEAAEKEAEAALHAAKHGDGLTREACDALIDRFTELVLADSVGYEEVVKKVLGEVRDDSMQACLDHGTQAEVACVEKAKVAGDLDECQDLF